MLTVPSIEKPNMDDRVIPGCATTWGEHKTNVEIEAIECYSQGYTENPYMEDSWPHFWFGFTILELQMDDLRGEIC